MTKYGVTRAKIVSHLESHEHDDFYLGTPYQGGDWQSPNGDTSYNGSAGMNCTGFVSYVLRACGLNTGTFLEQLSITGSTIWAGSGLPYDLMSGASNYLNAVQNGDIAAYTFRDKSELLASGLAQKGDILLMWWSLSPFDDGPTTTLVSSGAIPPVRIRCGIAAHIHRMGTKSRRSSRKLLVPTLFSLKQRTRNPPTLSL